ncbi:MAG: hypothetical protein AB1439_11965 [candidate division FCPU426 bacterium]
MKRAGWGLLLLAGLAPAVSGQAAVWKAELPIGFADVYAELDDATDPVMVMLRVENHSLTQPLKLGHEKSTDLLYMTFDGMTRDWDGALTGYSRWKKVFGISPEFADLTDADTRRLRPVLADELVAENLKALRRLLPQHVSEIDDLLSSIRSDYGKQKLVEVYGRLTLLKERGWPVPWWRQVGDWVAGRKPAGPEDYRRAAQMIEEINRVAENYLWPRSLGPGETVTGVLYFERPVKLPPRIFFRLGEKAEGSIGLTMRQETGDEKLK